MKKMSEDLNMQIYIRNDFVIFPVRYVRVLSFKGILYGPRIATCACQ